MPASRPQLRRRRDDLVQHVARSTDAAEVFRRASRRLRRLVPFDAAAWLGTDPGTGLPTSPVRIDDLDGITQAMCAEHCQRELLVEDVNLFRHRRFLRPLGFGDEMRTVLRVGKP